MIELYEASDVVRKEREAREEAERKQQEEEQRKEERKNRYNADVDQTLALIDLADDYDVACRIRRYISAVEGSGNPDEETAVWIEWAKAKADWYDPTIAREDEFFGTREHEEEPNRKKLEHMIQIKALFQAGHIVRSHMKAWKIKAIGVASVILLALACVFLFLYKPLPEGAVSRRDIVSYCFGDATNDGSPELLAIAGQGQNDDGERYGQDLIICDVAAEADIGDLGYIPAAKIRQRIDLSSIKPMKVQLGDVNGDGLNEVALCVYKTAKFHPVMAKRPFFFDLVKGNLIPLWLGSRLSRPFDDYVLYDLDADGIEEIVSIERLEDGDRVLAVYNQK